MVSYLGKSFHFYEFISNRRWGQRIPRWNTFPNKLMMRRILMMSRCVTVAIATDIEAYRAPGDVPVVRVLVAGLMAVHSRRRPAHVMTRHRRNGDRNWRHDGLTQRVCFWRVRGCDRGGWDTARYRSHSVRRWCEVVLRVWRGWVRVSEQAGWERWLRGADVREPGGCGGGGPHAAVLTAGWHGASCWCRVSERRPAVGSEERDTAGETCRSFGTVSRTWIKRETKNLTLNLSITSHSFPNVPIMQQ